MKLVCLAHRLVIQEVLEKAAETAATDSTEIKTEKERLLSSMDDLVPSHPSSRRTDFNFLILGVIFSA